MFYKFLIFSLLLIAVSCYTPERNCKDFKTGEFEFETYLNGEVVKTTFVRNDTLEIDFYEGKRRGGGGIEAPPPPLLGQKILGGGFFQLILLLLVQEIS